MPAARTCSECGKSLQGYAPQAKTDSAKCRQARARRTRKLAKAEAREAKQHVSAPVTIQQISHAVNEVGGRDVIKKVFEEELRPIVRDAVTEDTLRAISALLTLTPRAVAALAEDLESEDSVIRQRAYSLAIKYTIGHPALIKSDDADGSKQININVGLPRPESIDVDAEDILDIEEPRVCDLCGEEKPAHKFVANSDRCHDCADERKRRITEMYSE